MTACLGLLLGVSAAVAVAGVTLSVIGYRAHRATRADARSVIDCAGEPLLLGELYDNFNTGQITVVAGSGVAVVEIEASK